MIFQVKKELEMVSTGALIVIVARRERFSEDVRKARHQALRFFARAD